jgi:tryptophanyl-tRNA synthetase
MDLPLGEGPPDKRKRVLSGMRPTGRLHVGHYFGALQNWVRLQDDPQRQYECFFFIADWHALTSDYADTSAVAQNTVEVAIDYLAAGVDPDKCTLFLQSSVPEHAELHLLLSMVTPLGWLERVPTYKEALDNVKDKDLHTYGFFGYPVLESADIVMYGDPETELLVPVGEDQVAHVELTREIVRRFNFFYGFDISEELFRNPKSLSAVLDRVGSAGPRAAGSINPATIRAEIRRKAEETGLENFMASAGDLSRFFSTTHVLREPNVMLTHTPRIPGLDGRKMSKSYGNSITLSETDESIRSKTRAMMTDPARKRRTDPGNPELCPVFDWHKLFSPRETLSWASGGCVTAGIGCIECKAAMADHLIRWIEPVRQRRVDYQQQPDHVLEILDTGSKRARIVAQESMDRVREAIFHWPEKRAEIAGGSREIAKDVPARS